MEYKKLIVSFLLLSSIIMITNDMINDRINEILKEKGNNHFELYEIVYFFSNCEMTIEAIDDIDENIIFIDDKITSIINDINYINQKNKKRKVNYKNINLLLIDHKINLKTKNNNEIIALILNHIRNLEEKENNLQKKIRENYFKICFVVIVTMLIIFIIMAAILI
jgi:hypothetical protein